MGSRRSRARLFVVLAAVAAAAALGLTAFAAQPPDPRAAPTAPAPAPLAPVAPMAPAPVGAAPTGQVAVDPGWASRMATKAGIPLPAVRAYAVATLRLSTEDPGCGLGWTTLAGLGYVESLHGTIDDRLLLEDGRSSTPILGPALDGGEYAAIPASPTSAQWHGDGDWDHAVGPLQFIPSSWAQWQGDGDADGLADPNDLDDAAYAAGRYLCASGSSMASADGWVAAIFSYNHSDDYVRQVHAAASAYAERTG